MVEIKEGGLYVTDYFGYDQVGKFHVETKEFDTIEEATQLKQQILQDHEDAKKLKGLEEYYTNLSGLEQYKQWQKDRQIVKRLELWAKSNAENVNIPTKTLRKILEGKDD